MKQHHESISQYKENHTFAVVEIASTSPPYPLHVTHHNAHNLSSLLVFLLYMQVRVLPLLANMGLEVELIQTTAKKHELLSLRILHHN
jgi:hypothetical protein